MMVLMVGLLKKPTLASCVEKPPMAIVAKLWPIASNAGIPANHRASAQATVNST